MKGVASCRPRRELTHRFPWGPRLAWEAWTSILTVTLKEKQMTGRPRGHLPMGHPEVRLLPSLLSPQFCQLALGVQGFQEAP